jgi:hypothetical protein
LNPYLIRFAEGHKSNRLAVFVHHSGKTAHQRLIDAISSCS